MLFLRTFGGLSLSGGSTVTEGGVNGTRLSLLAFLAANGDEGVRRDRILLTFWGENDQDRARNALKQAVFALRKYSGEPDLILGVDELRINPAVLASDVGQFRAALRAGRLREAVDLHTGPFLDGVFTRSGQEFDQWRDTEQRKLLDEYHSALKQLAQSAESAGELDAAVAYWRRLTVSAPLDSGAALGLVQALARCGDRGGAASAARRHSETLKRELGIEADPRIAAAVTSTTSPAIGRSDPTTADSSASVPSERIEAAPSPDDAPRPTTGPVARRWSGVSRIVAAVAIVGVAVGLYTAARPSVPPNTTLVIAFDNKTGDPSLDAVGSLIADWTAGEIAAAGLTSVAPSMNTLSTAPGSARRVSSADLATKAVASDGFAFSVGGALYRRNDSIVVQPVVLVGKTKGMLGSVRSVSIPADRVESAPEQVAQLVTGALAVATNRHVGVLRAPFDRAPRYDAYVQYVAGLEHFHDDDRRGAFALFARARELDSSFVLPLIWQALIPGRRQVRDSLARVLESYGDRLSPLERCSLDYLRADLGDDQTAALRYALKAAALAPGSNWSYYAATKLALQNRHREALELLSSVDPRTWVGNWPAYWRFFIATAHRAGDDARAHRLLQDAAAYNASPLVRLRFHAMLEAAAGNEEGVARDHQAYTTLTTAPDSSLLFFVIAVNEAAYHGRTALRRSLGDTLVRVTTVPGDSSAARLELLAGAYQAAGRYAEAWPIALQWRARSADSVWSMGLLGVLAARTHNRAAALAYSDSLSRLTGRMKGEVTLHRARIAAALRDTTAAMSLIRQAYAEAGHVMWQHDSDFEELAGLPELEALRHPEARRTGWR